jgi:hypothetical protein
MFVEDYPTTTRDPVLEIIPALVDPERHLVGPDLSGMCHCSSVRRESGVLG